jgi:hypothetical protein
MSMSTKALPWIQPRDGLGELSSGLRDAPRTIAYLGASVTLQRDGYRPRLHERLQRRTGHEHRSITAAVGYSGSISAVFLMDDFVARHCPDLCVIELTTSDWAGATRLDELPSALDGIVTKLRSVGCEICFAHLYRADQSFSIKDPVLAAYEAAAERHGVPSLHVGLQLAAEAEAGAFDARDLLRDVVHTTPFGAELTAARLDEGLVELEEISTRRSPPPAVSGGPFAAARLVPPDPTWLEGRARASMRRFRLVHPFLRLEQGSRLCCSFDGELVGLVVIAGPTSGVVTVQTSHETEEVVILDRDCFYERLTTALLERRVPAREPVVIEQTDLPVDVSVLRRRMPQACEGAERELRLVGCMVR